ncbi:MAG: alpha/beta fold hydrolase [Anaerolineae bacterium]|nr:alpha/beta fold hydrolase [Anaerolineae bacterium]
MTASTLYKSLAGEQTVMAMYDAALKNWTAPYTTHTVPTRHGDTFVVASGDAHAPSLILLHGAGSNAAVWAGDVRDYAARYRVYAVDLIGEAGKSAPNRPTWESPAFAEWLDDVLHGLGVQQVTLVGISQGAWTALKYAVYAPERVDRLVLLTPGGIVPDRASFLFTALALMMLGNWGIKRMVRALFADQTVPAGVMDIVAQITSQFKPRIGVLPIFTDDELRRLTMPTLLLGGTKDILRDVDKIAARLRGLLPQLTVTMVQGAGHALINTSGCVMEFLTP